MKNTRIYLLGFMGVGKSTVAAKLAEELGWELIEMDEEIQGYTDKKISAIFKDHGEDYFRDIETKILKRTEQREEIVVSCGGGIVIRQENIDFMKEKGIPILLTATPKTIYNRICDTSHRPILRNRMSVDGIAEVLKDRDKKYRYAAEYLIATDEKTVDEITEEILSVIRNRSEDI